MRSTPRSTMTFLRTLKRNGNSMNNPQKLLHRLLADSKQIQQLFQHNWERYVERRNRSYLFQVCDVVLDSARHHRRSQLRRPSTLAPKTTGPFLITVAIGPHTFRLHLTVRLWRKFHNASHASNMISYVLRLTGVPDLHGWLKTHTITRTYYCQRMAHGFISNSHHQELHHTHTQTIPMKMAEINRSTGQPGARPGDGTAHVPPHLEGGQRLAR